MSTIDRRSARNQALPPDEAKILQGLQTYSLFARCAQLFHAGWTLRAIGEAFDPPRPRSTVQTWVDRGMNTLPLHPLEPVITPELATPKVYISTKNPSPGIGAADLREIQTLAPIARRYRAGMSPEHGAARANSALTALCSSLYLHDVTIRELADAAGVTYRAMAKRVGKA